MKLQKYTLTKDLVLILWNVVRPYADTNELAFDIEYECLTNLELMAERSSKNVVFNIPDTKFIYITDLIDELLLKKNIDNKEFVDAKNLLNFLVKRDYNNCTEILIQYPIL